MERLFEIVAVNAASVTVLAVAVAIAGRFIRRPSVRHALWLVVLLKLVTPPVFELGVIPTLPSAAKPSEPAFVTETAHAPATARAPVETPEAASGGPWAGELLAVWLAGVVALVALASIRAIRFARTLSDAAPPGDELRERIAVLAREMGLARCPPARLVAGRVPPMLWCRGLLLPADLMKRFEPAERDAVIAHELAHLRRGDPWVRYLELATVVLFWWHPIVWWARHHLRRAEEQACDALVVEWRPGATRIYANGLLKTLEFLAGRGRAIPGLATGALGTVQVKERLTMILNPSCRGKTPLLQRGSVAALAVATLVLFPTLADTSGPDETAVPDDVLAVEREIADLEYELQELNVRQMELQHVLETARLKRARMEFEKQRDELVAQGKEDEAEQLRLKLEEREHELVRMREEMDHARQASLFEYKLQRYQADIEAARAAGDEARAADLELEARQAMLEMKQTQLHAEKEMQARELSHKITQIKRQIEILSSQGRTEEARELENALQELMEEQETGERSERDEGAR